MTGWAYLTSWHGCCGVRRGIGSSGVVCIEQIGSTEIDDKCWIRPEDMKPQQRPTLYPCDVNHPCSDLAGEFAAAFAASSLVYRIGNPAFADVLLENAKESFKFADTFRGRYSDWGNAHGEYNSTSYGDELMWAATWLYFASADETYLQYVVGPNAYIFQTNAWTDDTKFFSWDQKSPGVQVRPLPCAPAAPASLPLPLAPFLYCPGRALSLLSRKCCFPECLGTVPFPGIQASWLFLLHVPPGPSRGLELSHSFPSSPDLDLRCLTASAGPSDPAARAGLRGGEQEPDGPVPADVPQLGQALHLPVHPHLDPRQLHGCW